MQLTPAQSRFFDIAPKAAEEAFTQFPVPISIQLAQCALESGWLEHMPPNSNNCFGIKATHFADPSTYVKAPTEEVEDGKLVTEAADWQVFASIEECFIAHAKLLASSPRYAECMRWKARPCMFAIMLQKHGYSTSPSYAEKLVTLILAYALWEYEQVPYIQQTADELM